MLFKAAAIQIKRGGLTTPEVYQGTLMNALHEQLTVLLDDPGIRSDDIPEASLVQMALYEATRALWLKPTGIKRDHENGVASVIPEATMLQLTDDFFYLELHKLYVQGVFNRTL